MKKTSTLQRSWEITGVCAKYFLFYKLNHHRRDSLGTRLRLACEELGLVFIKLGQILSTRYDILDREHCEELQKLLDEVPPFSYKVAQNIFKQDFGKYPEEIYAKFNPLPIASASVAQVFKAVTHDGRLIAVKIRRPGVDRAIRSDMAIFRKLALIGQLFSGDLRHIDIKTILKQLESWLIAEVDFIHEADNLDIVNDYYTDLSKNLDGEYARAIIFPSVHRDLSSENVLAMDFIEGVPVRQWKKIEHNPKYDIKASLKASLVATMRAWMNEDKLVFHGDPHPSNMLFLPHGRMALLDFGLIGYFEKKDIEQTRELFLAVYAKNVEQSIKISLEICRAPVEKYTPIIREDMKKYIEKSHSSALGYWFFEIIRIFVKHRVPMESYQLTLFSRSQAIIDGIFQTIMPGVSTLEILGDELERTLRQKTLNNLKSINVAPILYILSEKMKNSPEKIAGLVDKYFDDPLQAIHDFRKAIKI